MRKANDSYVGNLRPCIGVIFIIKNEGGIIKKLP